MLDCGQALELLSAEADGELSTEETAQLNAHLTRCPACRALLEDFAAMHAAMPPPAQAPAGLADKIMAQVRQTRPYPAPPAKKKHGRWKSWIPVAAVLVLALLGAGSLRMLSADSIRSSAAADAAQALTGADPDGTEENALYRSADSAPSVEAKRQSSDCVPSDLTKAGAESSASEPAICSLPAADAVESAAIQTQTVQTSASEPWQALLDEAGLSGPYCAILIVPGCCLPDWSQRDGFIALDGARAYLVSAGALAVLAEKASGWDDAEWLETADCISPDADQGLLLLTDAAQ